MSNAAHESTEQVFIVGGPGRYNGTYYDLANAHHGARFALAEDDGQPYDSPDGLAVRVQTTVYQVHEFRFGDEHQFGVPGPPLFFAGPAGWKSRQVFTELCRAYTAFDKFVHNPGRSSKP